MYMASEQILYSLKFFKVYWENQIDSDLIIHTKNKD